MKLGGKHLSGVNGILKELRDIRRSISRLHKIQKYTLLENPVKLFAFQFFVGIVRGVGSVIGATLVIALLAYGLSFFSVFDSILDFMRL
jgi:hypothetical protein